jgi:hypothetical protein
MTHSGSVEDWVDFLETLVPDIIGIVVDAWHAMPSPAGNELEDKVSEDLCIALRKSRSLRDLPLRIDSQQVELDPAAGEDQGRMDITFSPMAPREDIYFCLECKRLNVRDYGGAVRAYSSEYVRFGMFRFIRGQYARLVRFGGMLAFVLDGNLTSAITGVEANITTHHTDLGMGIPGQFQPSASRPADARIRETTHRRGADPAPFTIHHVFMAGDPAAPLRPPPTPPAPTPPIRPKRKRQSSP